MQLSFATFNAYNCTGKFNSQVKLIIIALCQIAYHIKSLSYEFRSLKYDSNSQNVLKQLNQLNQLTQLNGLEIS